MNLINLNAFTPYLHFQMKGLHLLNDIMKEKDHMCKIGLKMLTLCSTASKHRNYIWFCWEFSYTNSFVYVLVWDQLHEFLQNYCKFQYQFSEE